jgi:hypothetical protein
MIPLVAGHIPNIEISQVNGLQSAINSIIKTFASANDTAISISNNGVGDYTLTPHFGSSANTLAQGNDSRFPANVTGLRKSAGTGSTDIAAVAKTDYWDTTNFVASGASHAKGLVPDPGSSAGTTRFLREDATWVAPAGSGTVTSVALTTPGVLFSVAGSPVTTAGTLAMSLVTQTANRIFAGPTSGGAATPTFRVPVYADVSPIVGSSASTIAAGNDTRFPSSVTGLRKSAGAGSTDVAAVAGVDYAAATTFGSKGPSHSIGLVPDPGAGSAPYVRYLRDDGSWQVFTPDIASLTNPMLATMSAKTLKANATAGTASPTDVSALVARSSALLNLESITSFGNANYAGLATDRYISTSANFTATRTVTLPLANTFNPGQQITISDDFGAINGAFFMMIARSGSDTIQGTPASLVMDVPKGGYVLSSDGVSKWFVVKRYPATRRVVITSNGTYTTPTGVKFLIIEGLGDGGGGAGALGASSQASVGGGGGAGGYVIRFESPPLASYAVTIGPGGIGGIGALNGGNGAGTTFGAVLAANGGNGGITMATGTSTLFVNGGLGQYGSAGDWGSAGGDGGMGTRLSGTVAASGFGGAASLYSGTTQGKTVQGDGLDASAARHFGGGGGGAVSFNTTPQTGGPGGQGVIIVTEYY